jgi:hypothetical protein
MITQLSKGKRFFAPTLTAIVAVAITFTFNACSTDGGGGEGNESSLEYGGKTYKTVVIGTQNWMAENLNYNVSGSHCYDNLESNCNKYGRLYDWATAKTVCPAGWHLPSGTEWATLINYVGGSNIAGKKLKATSGWNNGGNGQNTYGFSALPGGIEYYLDSSKMLELLVAGGVPMRKMVQMPIS